MEQKPPSKVRGETMREVSSIIRGMLMAPGNYSIEDLPQFFADQAQANDILMDHADT